MVDTNREFFVFNGSEWIPKVFDINLPRLSVAAVIYHPEDGHLPLSERRYVVSFKLKGQPEDENKWQFPGGKVDPGETLFEALKREVLEEVGIEIDLTEVDESLPYVEQRFYNSTLWVCCIYIVEAAETDISNKEPKKAIGTHWCTGHLLTDLGPFTPICQTFLDRHSYKFLKTDD